MSPFHGFQDSKRLILEILNSLHKFPETIEGAL